MTIIPGPVPQGSICPTCERRIPVPKEDTTPRNRVTLAVRVPKDEQEDGAVIWDGLVDQCREELSGELGYDKDTPAYYVLTAVMSQWLLER